MNYDALALDEIQRLRQQLADKHQLFMCASSNYDRLAEHLVFANDQITELQRDRDELVVVLRKAVQRQGFSNKELIDARAALAKLGAGKGEQHG